jgi:ABC-type multidrug transport system fused ATPase/permease subunit
MRQSFKIAKRRGEEIFNYSMLDVLACTAGFLLFILFTFIVFNIQEFNLRNLSEKYKRLSNIENEIIEIKSGVQKITEDINRIKDKTNKIKSNLEKEQWWHNIIKIVILFLLLLILIISSLLYLRYKWLRMQWGVGIESYGEFSENNVIRFIIGCHRDYITIGSGNILMLYKRFFIVFILSIIFIITLLLNFIWFLKLLIILALAISMLFPFRSTKVYIEELNHNKTAFHNICNLIRSNEGKFKILFWIYPGGGRSFNAALRVMKEYEIRHFSMGVSE